MAEAQLLNFPLQALGHLHGHPGLAAWKHCRKLLSADAPEHVTTTQCGATALSDALQYVVAFLVAIGVVHGLEIIDIQHQERQRGALGSRPLELVVGAFEKMPAVAALGQFVGSGQALQFGFEVLFFGDVFGNADDDQRLARLALAVDKALVAQPAYLAVGGNDSILTVFDRAFVQHGGQAALGFFQVIRVNAVAPLVVVGQQRVGVAPENPFVGRADIEHLAGFPVECPQHRIDAHQQRAQQLFAFTQARDLASGLHQRHQGLGGLWPLRRGRILRVFIDHRH